MKDASCFPCSEADATVKTKTLEEIEASTGIDFNALVIDCEGCIPQLLQENPALLTKLEIVLMEEDRPDIADYKLVYKLMEENNFERVKYGFHSVWVKR